MHIGGLFGINYVISLSSTVLAVQRTPRRTHTRPLFLAAHARTWDGITHLAQGLTICLCASKIIPSLVMSLLNVPSTPFPPNFSSSSNASDWNQTKSGATSLGDGLPGRLVGPIPNAGCEPKFCVDVDSEHTPINLPSRNTSFPQEDDATTTASEDFLMICLWIKRGIPWLWVNCWLKFRICRTERLPCQTRGMFTILKQRAALERPTFPVKPAARYTEYYGCFRKRFWTTTCSRRTTLYILQQSKNLATSSQELRPDTEGNTKRLDSEMRREPQHSSIPVPRFQSGGGLLNHTGGTYSHSGMIDYPRFPTPWNFKVEKSTSRLKLVRKQQILVSQCNGSKNLRKRNQLTILWHHNRLQGEKISWQRYAWCDDCVCIEKTSRQACSLTKKSNFEEQRAQKYDRFSRGDKNCLHDLWASPCNRSLWSGTTTLRFVHFAEWRRPWHAFRCDLGRIVQIKMTWLYSASDRLGFVRSRNRSKQWANKSFTIEDICKTSYWSDDENSKLQGPKRSCGRRISHQKKAYVERKVWECFQWKAHGQCSQGSHVVSVMTNQYKETCTVVRDEKDNRLLPHQIGRPRLTKREKNLQTNLATDRKALQTGEKFHADIKFVKTRLVDLGILSCVKTTILRPDAPMEENVSSDMLRLMRRPAKSQRKVVRKGQLRYWRTLHKWVVYLKIFVRQKIYSTW